MPTSLIATLADVEREARIPLAERRLPTSTYELLCRAAERYADHIALQFLPQGSPDEAPVVFSYGDFVAQVTQTANLFHRLGLGQDDAAAFILPNGLCCISGGSFDSVSYAPTRHPAKEPA